MKITTYNSKGQKEEIEYTKKLVEQEPLKEEIVIDSYEKFRMCIKRSQEEQKIVGGGDHKYARALNKLVVEHHEQYQEYYAKLREQFNQGK